jgi:hypothetical protein
MTEGREGHEVQNVNHDHSLIFGAVALDSTTARTAKAVAIGSIERFPRRWPALRQQH